MRWVGFLRASAPFLVAPFMGLCFYEEPAKAQTAPPSLFDPLPDSDTFWRLVTRMGLSTAGEIVVPPPNRNGNSDSVTCFDPSPGSEITPCPPPIVPPTTTGTGLTIGLSFGGSTASGENTVDRTSAGGSTDNNRNGTNLRTSWVESDFRAYFQPGGFSPSSTLGYAPQTRVSDRVANAFAMVERPAAASIVFVMGVKVRAYSGEMTSNSSFAGGLLPMSTTFKPQAGLTAYTGVSIPFPPAPNVRFVPYTGARYDWARITFTANETAFAGGTVNTFSKTVGSWTPVLGFDIEASLPGRMLGGQMVWRTGAAIDLASSKATLTGTATGGGNYTVSVRNEIGASVSTGLVVRF